jgi:hypothetical protein
MGPGKLMRMGVVVTGVAWGSVVGLPVVLAMMMHMG